MHCVCRAVAGAACSRVGPSAPRQRGLQQQPHPAGSCGRPTPAGSHTCGALMRSAACHAGRPVACAAARLTRGARAAVCRLEIFRRGSSPRDAAGAHLSLPGRVPIAWRCIGGTNSLHLHRMGTQGERRAHAARAPPAQNPPCPARPCRQVQWRTFVLFTRPRLIQRAALLPGPAGGERTRPIGTAPGCSRSRMGCKAVTVMGAR